MRAESTDYQQTNFSTTFSVFTNLPLKVLPHKVVKVLVQKKQLLFLTVISTYRTGESHTRKASSVISPVKSFARFTVKYDAWMKTAYLLVWLVGWFFAHRQKSDLYHNTFVNDLHRSWALSTWSQMTGLIFYYILLLKSCFVFKHKDHDLKGRKNISDLPNYL